MKLCIVFDTNIIISGTLWSGAPRKALESAKTGVVQSIFSESLLDELKQVVERAKFKKQRELLNLTPEQIVSNFLAYTEIIEPTEQIPIARDVDDDAVLACALGGKADGIVTGDSDLLVLKIYETIPIWNVSEYLAHLKASSTAPD
ncbi:MAG: putative toxin-antitoxin system toxin component, PIN family [Chloroflexota bacterium]|nr:putative toxin-antitoxin system toxin component, PIN family [Chloroflexota bacterium]